MTNTNEKAAPPAFREASRLGDVEKLNPEAKEKWLAALRSGEYSQAKGALHVVRPDGSIGYCCLGVAAHLAAMENPEIVIDKGQEQNVGEYVKYDGWDAELPPSVRWWLGIEGANLEVTVNEDLLYQDGKSRELSYLLSEVNDELEMTFPQIADLIEEQL